MNPAEKLFDSLSKPLEDKITVNVLGIDCPIITSPKIYKEYIEWYKKITEKNKARNHQPAIGETFSLMLTPSSLGMVYEVIDNYTKESFNLTCYRNW